MKKIIALILTTIFAISSTYAIAGCNKSDATASVAASEIAVNLDEQVTGKPESAVKTFDYTGGVDGFVTRLYNLCLGREPDPTGFEYWTSKLESGEISARECAYGFFFSPEFEEIANNLTDESYVELFYNVFLGRESDPTGLANWLNVIANTTYDTPALFEGFVDSAEFKAIVESYGLTLGDPIELPNVERNVSANPVSRTPYAGVISNSDANAIADDISNGGTGNNVPVTPVSGNPGSSTGGNGGSTPTEPTEPTQTTTLPGGITVPVGPGNTQPTTTTEPTGTTNGGTDTTPAPTNGGTGSTPTQPSSGRYDPDNHGGYWIYGATQSISTQIQISTVASSKYSVITNSTEFNSYATYRCYYVCSSGYVISYSQYSQMNWSQASDPMFGAQSQAVNVYRGSYWQQGCANDATAQLAAGIYGTSAASDAFDYDGHVSGTQVVGMYCGNSAGQTYSYKKWDGDAVTNGGYTEIYNALLAYNRGARHSATILAKYGITSEGRGDYLMIEWCEGNTSYNVYTLPLPDFNNYCAMGSDSAHTHFVTNVTRNPGNSFAMSKSWNYNNRSANVVSTSGGNGSNGGNGGSTTTPSSTPTPAPTAQPTTAPTQPTQTQPTEPTATTPAPTQAPTEPTQTTPAPTQAPEPTTAPTAAPTAAPTPTPKPTSAPTPTPAPMPTNDDGDWVF